MKETAKRYHCEECDDYDLCVSCEYVQRSNRGHVNEEEESEGTIHPHPLTLLNPDDTSEGNLECMYLLFYVMVTNAHSPQWIRHCLSIEMNEKVTLMVSF